MTLEKQLLLLINLKRVIRSSHHSTVRKIVGVCPCKFSPRSECLLLRKMEKKNKKQELHHLTYRPLNKYGFHGRVSRKNTLFSKIQLYDLGLQNCIETNNINHSAISLGLMTQWQKCIVIIYSAMFGKTNTVYHQKQLILTIKHGASGVIIFSATGHEQYQNNFPAILSTHKQIRMAKEVKGWRDVIELYPNVSL